MFSILNSKMWQYDLQINFIFALCIIIEVNYGISQASSTANKVYFREEKCMNNSCCDDLRKLPAGVVCKNATDTNYMYFPNDFPLIDNIYEIEFTDTKYLPGSVFEGKLVRDIVVDDPDVTVDSNVLEGIVALDDFIVRRSSIKAVPDFGFVKDSIERISIVSSLLTSLEGENLQNLTEIYHLSFSNNHIRFIDPDVFKGTVNVKMLDLSQNLLTFIPENLLNPMKNLVWFHAYNNSLIHVNNLFSVTRPPFIFLYHNNISHIGSAMQLRLENVQKMASPNYFLCKADGIGISMDHFQSFANIQELDLSHNSIKETSRSIFLCYKKGYGYGYGHVLSILNLNLSGNHLKNLNVLLGFLRVINLWIAENQIQYLTDEDFKLTSGIASLDFRKNSIRRIETDTFKPIRFHLVYLDLSSNFIMSLNGSIRYLIRLRHLDLTHNSIGYFAAEEFSGLEELLFFNLEHNQIKTIEQLQQLPHLRYLNIKHNDIESISPDRMPKTLKWMHLAENPIRCNCLFHLFLRRLNSSSIATDIDTCSKTDFGVSEQKKSNSQDMCSYRCTNNENVSFIFVDCSSKMLAVVPQFLKNNLTEVEITFGHWSPLAKHRYYQLGIVNSISLPLDHIENYNLMHESIYSKFHIEDKVLGINLENNSLESLETAQFPPNLIQLYLSNNKLRRIPVSIFENQRNLKQVTLSGNPWTCDCDTLTFKKWLTSEKANIKDIDNVRCGKNAKEVSHLNGRVIWNLTDLDLCSKEKDQTLISAVPSGALTFVIICLTAKVLYAKYELNIKVLLYSRGFTFVKDEDLDYEKMFDAFVSFSHNDDEFVIKELVSVIEDKDPTIRLCLHYRHFLAGDFIYQNILRAVQNSKKTLVILSRSFLESEWCLLEFKTAHAQAMEDKVHRIILIKVGDLPKDIDPAIKIYLNSTTYLKWEENNFWEKLFYVLPSQSSTQNPNNVDDNETFP